MSRSAEVALLEIPVDQRANRILAAWEAAVARLKRTYGARLSVGADLKQAHWRWMRDKNPEYGGKVLIGEGLTGGMEVSIASIPPEFARVAVQSRAYSRLRGGLDKLILPAAIVVAVLTLIVYSIGLWHAFSTGSIRQIHSAAELKLMIYGIGGFPLIAGAIAAGLVTGANWVIATFFSQATRLAATDAELAALTAEAAGAIRLSLGIGRAEAEETLRQAREAVAQASARLAAAKALPDAQAAFKDLKSATDAAVVAAQSLELAAEVKQLQQALADARALLHDKLKAG